MGNYVSCTLGSSPLMKSNKAARVVFPGGEVKQFRELMRAAEVMLECPNFFLVNSKSLHIGRRFSALGADEELEFGNVYVMFPMKRVNSLVSAADMAALFMAANSAAKRISAGGNTRVLPDSEQETSSAAPPSVSLEDVEEGFSEFKYRLVVCRSRKPLLETIKEEAIYSR